MQKEIKLGKIAEMLNGKLVGDPDIIVSSVSAPEYFSTGAISPLWEKKFISSVKPGMVLLTKTDCVPEGCSGVEVEEPRRSLTTLLEFFAKQEEREKATIHNTAVIDSSAHIGKEVMIGPNCVVSAGAEISDGAVLRGNVWVGRNVKIGSKTVIDPCVVLYDNISIGSRCLLHANAVIGCDGFGFIPDPDIVIRRIPQIGTVVIEDDVEVGAGTCIDRATFGETHISKGTKIDAQVKIGHNCHVGAFSIIVAQAGLAGSSTIGSGVTIASQAGVANHATVGDGATLASRSGVVNDVPAGATVSGFPAQEHLKDMRQAAVARHLPEIEKTVRALVSAVKRLEQEKQ